MQLMFPPKAQPGLQHQHQTAPQMKATTHLLRAVIALPTTQMPKQILQKLPAMRAQARHRPIPARRLFTSSGGMLEHSAGSEIALHSQRPLRAGAERFDERKRKPMAILLFFLRQNRPTDTPSREFCMHIETNKYDYCSILVANFYMIISCWCKAECDESNSS